MRVLVKSLLTSLFLAASGDWTPEMDDALDFQNGEEAIEYSVKKGIKKVSINYTFEDSKYNFEFKIDK